jgi:hypothetical protein
LRAELVPGRRLWDRRKSGFVGTEVASRPVELERDVMTIIDWPPSRSS